MQDHTHIIFVTCHTSLLVKNPPIHLCNKVFFLGMISYFSLEQKTIHHKFPLLNKFVQAKIQNGQATRKRLNLILKMKSCTYGRFSKEMFNKNSLN